MVDMSASNSVDQQRDEVRAVIRAGASFTPTYVVMNALAAVIACYGLLVDSVAGIIGAMVVALLLGPIAGVGLALVDDDRSLLKKAAFAELGGVATVMATAFFVGAFHGDIPLGSELLARTTPGFADLMIALAGGAAAAIASITRGMTLSLVGVAVATALVPPLSTCSMLLARGDIHLAFGAFLLAFTNMVAIQFATSVVFWIAGYSRITQLWSAGYRVFLRNLMSIILLVILGVVLGLSTHHTVTAMLFEAKVRKTLQGSLKGYPGSYLADVRFDKEDGKTIVRAVIRSPRPFSAQDVTVMERQLPRPPDGSQTGLWIRRLPVEVMTEKGPIFELERASDRDVQHGTE